MNYRLIRNVRPRGRFLDFGLPLIFVAVILVFHLLYPKALGELVSRIASPIFGSGRFVGREFHATLFLFSSKETLVSDVERLTAELEEAKRLLLDRDLLREENRLLKEQFGRAETEGSRLIGAVLSTPPRSPYDSAVIDIGERDGVAVGDLALSGSAVLGRVGKVYGSTSLVEFFSSAGKTTPVLILHAGDSIPVDAIGEGGGAFTVTLPKEVEIGADDPVVMPGDSTLLFSKVEALLSSDTDSFQVVRFKNPISFSKIRFLEILKQGASE